MTGNGKEREGNAALDRKYAYESIYETSKLYDYI